MSRIERKVGPFADRSVEPDAPHMGTSDEALAASTETLAYRLGGSCRSWVYPAPGPMDKVGGPTVGHSAPMATIVAVDTWCDFMLGNLVAPMQVPWRHCENMAGIYVEAVIACEFDCILSFRCISESLVAAATTTNGGRSASGAVGLTPPMHLWAQASQAADNMMRVRRLTSNIVAPALPADGSRRIALHPQVKVTQQSYPLFELGTPGRLYIHLTEMQAADVWDIRTGGL